MGTCGSSFRTEQVPCHVQYLLVVVLIIVTTSLWVHRIGKNEKEKKDQRTNSRQETLISRAEGLQAVKQNNRTDPAETDNWLVSHISPSTRPTCS
jgi:membrane protein implicated in regulation of membrane protease activity